MLETAPASVFRSGSPRPCGQAALVFMILACAPALINAQEVRGTLSDARTQQPVRDAQVRLYGASGVTLDSAVTDAGGAFRFVISRAGTYELAAERSGYVTSRRQTISIGVNEIVTVTLLLDTVVVLAPLTVTARAADPMEWLGLFRERRQFYQHLGARFFTRSDFDWLAATTVSEAIVSLMSMYQYDSRPVPGREGHSTGRAVLAIRRFHELCEPDYYVNGHLIRINRRQYPEARIEDYVALRSVTAIEVYRPGAARPGDVADRCGGAIVFWTLGPEGSPEPP